jgi:hypothetical protein
MAELPAGQHPDDRGNHARKRMVELTKAAGPGAVEGTQAEALERAQQVAGELAALLAHEHRRVTWEQARRETAEACAAELVKRLAEEHAAVRRERTARSFAEARAAELAALTAEPPFSRRFANVRRNEPPLRPPLPHAFQRTPADSF